jgi:hypothetical protein
MCTLHIIQVLFLQNLLVFVLSFCATIECLLFGYYRDSLVHSVILPGIVQLSLSNEMIQ